MSQGTAIDRGHPRESSQTSIGNHSILVGLHYLPHYRFFGDTRTFDARKFQRRSQRRREEGGCRVGRTSHRGPSGGSGQHGPPGPDSMRRSELQRTMPTIGLSKRGGHGLLRRQAPGIQSPNLHQGIQCHGRHGRPRDRTRGGSGLRDQGGAAQSETRQGRSGRVLRRAECGRDVGPGSTDLQVVPHDREGYRERVRVRGGYGGEPAGRVARGGFSTAFGRARRTVALDRGASIR
mmetsp:Transcript_2175/g.5100  ORF Transcript_2175/g.5100 Transcript_2175/m.5100 type:complete len:235 (-) Transcript_2175:1204-1908(-)